MCIRDSLVGVVLRVCQELSLVFVRAEVVKSAFKEGCGFRCVFPYLLSAYRINQHGSSLSCLRFRTSLSASNDLLEALHHVRSACLAVTSEPEITALLCVFQEVAEAAIAVPRFTELRPLPLHGVLHHRGEDGIIVLPLQRGNRFKEKIKDLAFGLGDVITYLGRCRIRRLL